MLLPKPRDHSPEKIETTPEKRKREREERIEELKFKREELEALNKIREAEGQQASGLSVEYQKIVDELTRGEAKVFGFTFAAKALRQKWSIEHKDNPDLLKKLNEWLEEIERGKTLSF